jgi:hypothetical protein
MDAAATINLATKCCARRTCIESEGSDVEFLKLGVLLQCLARRRVPLDPLTAVKENATACRGVFFSGRLAVELL